MSKLEALAIIRTAGRLWSSRPTLLARADRIGAAGVLLAALLSAGRSAAGEDVFIPLKPLRLSQTTGEKPQSKVWRHAGRWWAVLPGTAVSPSGTWLWRLGADRAWKNVLRLSSSRTAKADVKALGDVTHILLHTGSAQLVSVQYRPDQESYALWRERPDPTALSLSASATATIEVDSTGRMWLATGSGSDVLVYHSDPPYDDFDGPIVLDDGISSGDIAVVTALPEPVPPSVGVLWSNQKTERFGFRLHVDGTDPIVWLPDEVPAGQSALRVGGGMADDHLNVAVGSDGTLYAAVKTSYDTRRFPSVALLLRHPDGVWDDLHFVDDVGTRGIVLLNEEADLLRVIYTGSTRGDDIVYRDPQLSLVRFGARQTLIPGTLSDATSTKDRWTDELVVLASRYTDACPCTGEGMLARIARLATTTTVTTSTSTTTSSTSSTTTTFPAGANAVELRIAAGSDDAEEDASGSVSLSSSDIELVRDDSDQTVGLRFTGLAIPRAARITTAHLQFTVDQTAAEDTALTIAGQATDDAATFTTASRNVSARARTAATVGWTPGPWSTVDASGPAQRSPDLAAVVQEVVNRSGWAGGNALAFIRRSRARPDTPPCDLILATRATPVVRRPQSAPAFGPEPGDPARVRRRHPIA